MDITIGTAPDAWGVWFPDDPKQTPWPRFLKEVAEAGGSRLGGNSQNGKNGFLKVAVVDSNRAGTQFHSIQN